jgi:hypothetical protein
MTGDERTLREISGAVAKGDNVYAKLHTTGVSIELTNNRYISGFSENDAQSGKIYGSDIVSDKK